MPSTPEVAKEFEQEIEREKSGIERQVEFVRELFNVDENN